MIQSSTLTLQGASVRHIANLMAPSGHLANLEQTKSDK